MVDATGELTPELMEARENSTKGYCAPICGINRSHAQRSRDPRTGDFWLLKFRFMLVLRKEMRSGRLSPSRFHISGRALTATDEDDLAQENDLDHGLRDNLEPTYRAVSTGMEQILHKSIPVLDHGFIRVVDYMGNDAAVVQAARVSYGRGTKKVSEDRGLIRYLMRTHIRRHRNG